MRIAYIAPILAALCAAAPVSVTPLARPAAEARPTPLILEKDEGERRVIRPWPGHPDPGESFILKVDAKNGASSHLVLVTVSLKPGGELTTHKHPGADEILYLENGTARVQLGDSVREVHSGSTVFIPSGTWISLSNIGKEPIHGLAIFSAPGFDGFMRDVSVGEGEPILPMSEAENTAVEQKHKHDVIYK